VAADKIRKITGELRYVCQMCGGIYFAPVNGVCPGCKGPMSKQEVEYDDEGTAHVKTD
jgi:uncharacterized OB-fold protein